MTTGVDDNPFAFRTACSPAIGVAVLAACLTASQTLGKLLPSAVAARVLEESLIIVGRLANPRPIEICLHD